tara:strand:- start:995 stop:1387 length:393 start_codon:yes stop_codon:yes gene_type:complete
VSEDGLRGTPVDFRSGYLNEGLYLTQTLDIFTSTLVFFASLILLRCSNFPFLSPFAFLTFLDDVEFVVEDESAVKPGMEDAIQNAKEYYIKINNYVRMALRQEMPKDATERLALFLTNRSYLTFCSPSRK